MPPTDDGLPACMHPTCLYLLLTTDSFEEAILEVVNLGGDADTAGAILGALAGAHYSERGISERLLEGLQNREGIATRAEALAMRSSFGLNIPDLVETERRLSEREACCRNELLALQKGGGDLGANRRL